MNYNIEDERALMCRRLNDEALDEDLNFWKNHHHRVTKKLKEDPVDADGLMQSKEIAESWIAAIEAEQKSRSSSE